jgi:wobble nucleotide-excising tRNase
LESKYIEMMDKVSSLKGFVTTLRSQIHDIERECLEMEVKLSETVKGAEKVNECLQAFWGRDDIELKVNVGDTFQLHRGAKLAKNLSEGEKTAISFAYFITKLEEKGADLSKTIVYVDDPISSLDSNHLFSIYSFVKNKLANAHQLFISTHNYEFLNLMKDWLMDDFKNKSSFYVVERCRDNGSFLSCISNMPEELTKFKSEFHYLL